ncbi:MAG: PRC-barrel domain-containing protein [Candidatus Nanoarchaeia archaeon]|nr:PRC-barrel domain-containing protein [Candidatus Nanoarchaeia archaeon]
MLKTHYISDVYDMKVFTSSGEYFGDLDEAVVSSNKVTGWRIIATKNSLLSEMVNGAKGVIVPHQLVMAVGDIMIVNRAAISSKPKTQAEE